MKFWIWAPIPVWKRHEMCPFFLKSPPYYVLCGRGVWRLSLQTIWDKFSPTRHNHTDPEPVFLDQPDRKLLQYSNLKLLRTLRSVPFRAGNSLILLPSESLVFCPKMSEWAICSKKWAIHSCAHFLWAKWTIRSNCSFPLSDLSKSLIFGEQNEQFAHIAH